MSVVVKLPPTPLAETTVETLLVAALSTTPSLEAEARFRREPDTGLTVVEVDLTPDQLHTALVAALEKKMKPSESRPPLIPGAQNDGGTLSSILGRRVSLSKQNIPSIYSSLTQIISRCRPETLASRLGDVKIELGRGDVLRICLGGCDYRVPRIMQSDAFYEIGRFGGLSDRRSGQPQTGRVEYKAGKEIDSMLFAGLLATHVGGEEVVNVVHVFATVRVQPGSNITQAMASNLEAVYRELLKRTRSIGLRAWAQDYEGLRLVTILDMVRAGEEMGMEQALPASMLYTVISMTGRRTYGVTSIEVSFDEVCGYRKTLETFAAELGLTSAAQLAEMLEVILSSILRLLARRGEVQQRLLDVWVGTKKLTYAALAGARHVVLDELYRMLRLLIDRNVGLGTELASETTRVAEDLGAKCPAGWKALHIIREFAKLITG